MGDGRLESLYAVYILSHCCVAAMSVLCRFAPSPTGTLHIGGARTALFNHYFARRMGGKMLLRIEDTDRERSTDAAVRAILDGLSWLGIPWAGEPVFQFARQARHAEVVAEMLSLNMAYRCYASPQELEAMRAEQKEMGLPQRYDGRWRDRNEAEAPAGVRPVIRLKAPQSGETLIKDLVMGEITVQNSQMDDLVLLRADGTPTYMLAVVVDDYDMGITHVIRGDDHLTNMFRQVQIFNAMGWRVPEFAHVPMILGPDGTKLSKRHGAMGIEAYRDMGYLPEALRNYLLRLGWGHGDTEIVSDEEAVALFSLDGVGRSPARFDFTKLASVNAHYIRAREDSELAALVAPMLEAKLNQSLTEAQRQLLEQAMPDLKQRAKTLQEIAESALFFFAQGPLIFSEAALKILDEAGCKALIELYPVLAKIEEFSATAIEQTVRHSAEQAGQKLGNFAQPLRAALSGNTVSPPIFAVAALLGRQETLRRLECAIKQIMGEAAAPTTL